MKFKKFKQKVRELEKSLPENITNKLSTETLKEVPKDYRVLYIVSLKKVISELSLEHSVTEDKSETDRILAERGANYGKFTNHAKLSQTLKTAFDNHVREYGQPELFTNTMNEAIEMVFHKLARIANGNPTYKDNYVDIIGYTQLVLDELNGIER